MAVDNMVKCLFSLLWLGSLALLVHGDYSKPPNIILVMSDDLGQNDLGIVNRNVLTPNIDKLASDGVILHNHYVQSVCSPTRHALLTGRYPFKTGTGRFVIDADQSLCTPTDIELIPDKLKPLGYNTYMTGKWHMGMCRDECMPTNRGFDEFYGFLQGAQGYYDHVFNFRGNPGFDWRNGTRLDRTVDGIHTSHIINDYIVDTLTGYKSRNPFFMFVSLPHPHTPLEVAEKYTNFYPSDLPTKRRVHLGLVTAMDEIIGNMTTVLKSTGLYDDTIIIFVNDNGGEHGGTADNLPYRGSKGSMFEGGIRGMSFVHGKRLRTTGYTHKGLFHAIDWLPTILGLAGVKSLERTERELDGVDNSEMILDGKASARNDMVLNIDMMPGANTGQSGVRIGDYKLIWGSYGYTDGYGENITLIYADNEIRANMGLPPYQANTEGGSILSNWDFSPATQQDLNVIAAGFEWRPDNISTGLVHLFNLADDPYEHNNLADDPQYGAVLLQLKLYTLYQYSQYVEIPPAWREIRPSSHPDNFDGAWAPGWCDDVDFSLASVDNGWQEKLRRFVE